MSSEEEQLLLSKGARYRSLRHGTMKVTLPGISVATIGDMCGLLFFSFLSDFATLLPRFVTRNYFIHGFYYTKMESTSIIVNLSPSSSGDTQFSKGRRRKEGKKCTYITEQIRA